jgi:hypothetical protein
MERGSTSWDRKIEGERYIFIETLTNIEGVDGMIQMSVDEIDD